MVAADDIRKFTWKIDILFNMGQIYFSYNYGVVGKIGEVVLKK